MLIAKVDAEAPNAKKLASDQGVSSYPTIKFFPRGSAEASPYEGGRSEDDLVAFMNSKAGTHRVAGGGLNAVAGTIDALDSLVSRFTGKQEPLAAVSEQVVTAAGSIKDTYAAYYVKVFNKIKENPGYVEKESGRLASLLKKGGLAPAKMDDLIKRSNILHRFRDAVEDAVTGGSKEEL